MTGISRRAVLRGTSAMVGVAAFGGGWAAAAAEGSRGVIEGVVRDADMVWRRLPGSWQDAPFLANGFLGVQVYKGPSGNVLKFMLSHSLVQDQRAQWEAAVGLSRLPIGFLTLTLAGAITAVDWRLDLWNAELSGTVTTTQGALAFSAVVHNGSSVLLASLEPTEGERGAAWGFTPLPSSTTRTIRKPPDYVGNPAPVPGSVGPVQFVEQSMHAGGGYTTAWQEKVVGSRRLLAATVAYSFPAATSTADAVALVGRTLAEPPDALVAEHRAWWNAFYERSFVSVPDKKIQRFYWIQLYKMASATRTHAPVVTEWGPWFPEVGNSWTAVWWNLNVQAAYPLINGANHIELDAVTETFRRHHQNLAHSVPPDYRDGNTYALSHPGDRTLHSGGPKLGTAGAVFGAATVGIPGTATKTDQTGNLIWGMHNVWLTYRHTMDRQVLRDVLHPILTKAVNFYLHFLVPGADGRLHLPLTRSPEYADAADCTYDLSLIRWGCQTLLDNVRLLRLDDPNVGRWQDVLNRLVPYHHSADGVLIGDGVPLADSHRHYSHLLWLYPLREFTWDRPADRDIIRRSFDHWTSLRGAWHGYSFAAASSMLSTMGAAEESLGFLTFFLDRNIEDNTQLTPNTMYREGSNFAIESPLTAAQSVLDMLVLSHGGVISIFPAVSATWRDVSVRSLRTQGAFLVDASRRDGLTEWVRVHSEAGEPLVVRHGIPGEIEVRDERGRRLPFRTPATRTISLRLRRGATAIIAGAGSRPVPEPRDVPANGTSPAWGLPE